MERFDRYLIAVVALHVTATILHATAHAILAILPEGADLGFIVAVILVGPPVAVVVFRFRRMLGAGLVAALMGASFVYGFYNHFLGTGPDHVAIVSSQPWTAAFVISGAVLGALEIAAVIVAFLVLRSAARTPSGPAAPLA